MADPHDTAACIAFSTALGRDDPESAPDNAVYFRGPAHYFLVGIRRPSHPDSISLGWTDLVIRDSSFNIVGYFKM